MAAADRDRPTDPAPVLSQTMDPMPGRVQGVREHTSGSGSPYRASSRSLAALACGARGGLSVAGRQARSAGVRQGIPHVGLSSNVGNVGVGRERARGEGRSAERKARSLAERDAAARDGRARAGRQGGGGDEKREHGSKVQITKVKLRRSRG